MKLSVNKTEVLVIITKKEAFQSACLCSTINIMKKTILNRVSVAKVKLPEGMDSCSPGLGLDSERIKNIGSTAELLPLKENLEKLIAIAEDLLNKLPENQPGNAATHPSVTPNTNLPPNVDPNPFGNPLQALIQASGVTELNSQMANPQLFYNAIPQSLLAENMQPPLSNVQPPVTITTNSQPTLLYGQPSFDAYLQPSSNVQPAFSITSNSQPTLNVQSSFDANMQPSSNGQPAFTITSDSQPTLYIQPSFDANLQPSSYMQLPFTITSNSQPALNVQPSFDANLQPSSNVQPPFTITSYSQPTFNMQQSFDANLQPSSPFNTDSQPDLNMQQSFDANLQPSSSCNTDSQPDLNMQPSFDANLPPLSSVSPFSTISKQSQINIQSPYDIQSQSASNMQQTYADLQPSLRNTQSPYDPDIQSSLTMPTSFETNSATVDTTPSPDANSDTSPNPHSEYNLPSNNLKGGSGPNSPQPQSSKDSSHHREIRDRSRYGKEIGETYTGDEEEDDSDWWIKPKASEVLYFKNLPLKMPLKDLEDHLRKSGVGEIKYLMMSGKGFAIVGFRSPKDAAHCVKLYNGSRINRKTIEVMHEWKARDYTP